jgi:hypothetical protein
MSSYSDTDDDSYDESDDESDEGSHDIKSILEKFEDAVSKGSVSDETLDIVVNICGMIFTANTVMGSMAAYTSDPTIRTWTNCTKLSVWVITYKKMIK